MSKQPYAVVIGRNCIDQYFHTSDTLHRGDKLRVAYRNQVPGGFMGNTACVIGGLGGDVYMIDDLGNDKNTDVILGSLTGCGVKPDLIHIHETENLKAMIIIEDVGERTIILFRDDVVLDFEDEDRKKVVYGAEYFYTNIRDIKKWDNPRKRVLELRANGVKIAIDAESNTYVSRQEDLFYFENADFISINDYSYEKFSEGKGDKNLIALFEKNPDLVIANTLGNKGCRVLTNGCIIEQTGYNVTPVDTTGAGDTFNGSFIYGLMQKWSVEECAKFANAAAARSILIDGPRSGAVSQETVEAFIKNGCKL